MSMNQTAVPVHSCPNCLSGLPESPRSSPSKGYLQVVTCPNCNYSQNEFTWGGDNGIEVFGSRITIPPSGESLTCDHSGCDHDAIVKETWYEQGSAVEQRCGLHMTNQQDSAFSKITENF